MLPGVLTTMLPSLPSNVLGARTAPEDATNKMPKAAAATSVAPKNRYLRPLPRRKLLSVLICFPFLPFWPEMLLAQPSDWSTELKSAATAAEPFYGLVPAVQLAQTPSAQKSAQYEHDSASQGYLPKRLTKSCG